MHNSDKAAFTIATGRPVYLQMACALARSFRLWNADLPFYLATDARPSDLPPDLRGLPIIRVTPGEYGYNFSPKLFLDRMAPAERSLFIDADCLCVGSLASAFEKFRGHAVSVIGREIHAGEWFGDVARICRRIGVGAMPRFNGGIYYLEKGDTCSKVYECARELEKQYDELGFIRLRGSPNDEVLVSLAMALHGQKPIAESGNIMNSLLAGPSGIEIDVFKGKATLFNFKDDADHNPWYELEIMRPAIVHFLGTSIETYPYCEEERRLELVCGRCWPISIATLFTKITASWPWLIVNAAKGILRPFYHFCFGARQVKSSRAF